MTGSLIRPGMYGRKNGSRKMMVAYDIITGAAMTALMRPIIAL